MAASATSMYALEITRRAKRDFRRLPREQQRRIWDAVQALAVQPRPPGCKRLAGEEALYRIRVRGLSCALYRGRRAGLRRGGVLRGATTQRLS